jgi:hypothetical protein
MPFRPAPMVVVHLLIWCLVFLTPLIMLNQHRNDGWQFIPWLLFPLGSAMGGFYANYLFFIPRLLFQRRITIFLLANVVLFAGVSAFNEVWRYFLQSRGLLEQHSPFFSFEAAILRGFMAMIVLSGVAVAVRMTRQWYTSEGERRQLEAESLRSELSFLRLQLSPHFLFNTLNNITVLIDEDSQRAKNSILHLSKLLRSLLYEASHDSIPIESELRFLDSYIQLMRLRFGPELDFKMHVDIQDSSARMAPLLLMPLVENAFKHAIATGEQSIIHLHIATCDGTLYYEGKNSYRPKTHHDKSGSGVGLENLRKRLHLLYPKTHTYEVQVLENIYITRLSIVLQSPAGH